MQSLLDIIGATIIGGLLMVTMFTSMITIQENNMILKGEMQIITELEYISNMIDDYYMDKIGYELPSTTEAFPVADQNEVWFNAKLDDGDNNIYLVKISTSGEVLPYGYPMNIVVTGLPDVGPIYLADNLVFAYFDVSGNEIDSATLASEPGRATIRSIQIEMVVYQGEYNTDTMRARTLVFTKYFPNLAI
ncbi:MAG: hypothetical protein RAO94_09520 [Candidatus Stygibacter australis]|nr:hypothetical protein [Candidatus Stygibacter australis]